MNTLPAELTELPEPRFWQFWQVGIRDPGVNFIGTRRTIIYKGGGLPVVCSANSAQERDAAVRKDIHSKHWLQPYLQKLVSGVAVARHQSRENGLLHRTLLLGLQIKITFSHYMSRTVTESSNFGNID
jgi:hypothetical protein